MALSAAERQQRRREKVRAIGETRATKAAFADRIKDSFRQAALAALAGWATGRADDVTTEIAAEIDAHLESPAALLKAAATEGEAWARAQWLGRQGTKGRKRA